MKEFERQLDILILVLCLSVAAWLLMGCQSTRYVTVPESHTTIVQRRDTIAMRDSIHVHDSICVTHWGDTVYMDRWHTVYRDRWRDRVRVDSFIQRDTVTVIREVEKPPNRRQRMQQRIVGGAVGTAVGVILACVCILYIRRRK